MGPAPIHCISRRLISRRAFTLVELVVTVGIFALISSVIIARNATFDEEILLNNLAYDIALSVRRAQNYGINVRTSAPGEFDNPYGIYFENGTTTYWFFSNTGGDDDTTFENPAELLETFTLSRGAKVKAICDLSSAECDLDELTILFKRPDPDAWMYTGTDPNPISRARVDIESARGGTRSILIESTGQISIQRPSEEEGEK